MKDGRTQITQAYCAPMANAYLYCIQKGIHFHSDDYNGTPAVLFIWLKAQMICIDSLFIHCWTQHCIYECRQNGPNYSKRCLPVTPKRRKMMKASNWEERSNQRPLVVLCKFKNRNGKHFLLWLTMAHWGSQIWLVYHMHVLEVPPFFSTVKSPLLSLDWPYALCLKLLVNWSELQKYIGKK